MTNAERYPSLPRSNDLSLISTGISTGSQSQPHASKQQLTNTLSINDASNNSSNKLQNQPTAPSPDNSPPLLEGLNPQQKEAVLHHQGPVILFAGAGSGKTRVLTHRFAHLVSHHKVPAYKILAVTFTNKAALEMKERIGKLISSSNMQAEWVSTFHSFCARIMRRHGHLLGYNSNFVIYDKADSNAAIKKILRKKGLEKLVDVPTVSRYIDLAKNNYVAPDEFAATYCLSKGLDNHIAEVYGDYQKELALANAMDFSDLIFQTITLFKLEKAVLEQYQDLFDYLLVDEFQDTNKVQYMLLRALALPQNNMFVVGDDDQSIYSFRGASSDNINKFKTDYPNTKLLYLNLNYRSSGNIITLANHIIDRNTLRHKKSMKSTQGNGCPVYTFRGYNEKHEAEFITQHITALTSSSRNSSRQNNSSHDKRVPLNEIVILYRVNSLSRAVEEQLYRARIPYTIYGGLKFYDRKEIKDILAYFRLLINPKDNEAFSRIINTPARALGDVAIGKLNAFCSSKYIPLLEGLQLAVGDDAKILEPALKRKFKNFLDLYEELDKEFQAGKVLLSNPEASIVQKCEVLPSILRNITMKTRYLDKAKATDREDFESRSDNLNELYYVAQDFSFKTLSANEDLRLEDFLEKASLSSDLDKSDLNKDDLDNNETSDNAAGGVERGKVSLMSLHLAKGLEFEVAFLIGLEEGILPHFRANNSKEDMEEERRLCYVGVTRAKSKLYLSYASTRRSYGANQDYSRPSRFLDDLPSNVIQPLANDF